MLAFAAWTIAPNAVSAALVAWTGRRKPECPRTSLQPPGWVFGVAWTAIYLAMGVSMALLSAAGDRVRLAQLVALTVGLNAWWLAFGGKCRPRPALAAISVLYAASLWVTSDLLSANPAAGALLTPLCAWMTLATVLSVQQALNASPA